MMAVLDIVHYGDPILNKKCASVKNFEELDGIVDDMFDSMYEEEGIGLSCGAWAGGRRSALLMQSSGVGNCINALALPNICKIPFLSIVSMRGEWGEFIPWQVPMGKGTPKVLEAMNVNVFRADKKEEVGLTVDAAAKFAFNTRSSSAVLLSQRMIGAKQFKNG